ncbi:MAG: hypothetical protein KME42_21895 [Tildeniella nuda ZEHNDER 1965/U140]|nr:hypothetical protein [Tildeniella nuda ZEHNDER 1965/U140]
MNEELKKRLQSEIEKSGFPLELDITEKLRDLEGDDHFLVFPNISYVDLKGASHEIDVLALYNVNEEDNTYPFGATGILLVIECKKSFDKPWVFFEEFTDPLTLLGLGSKVDYCTDLNISKKSISLLIACANSSFSGHHYNNCSFYNDSPLAQARTYFEAFRSLDVPSTIHKAVLSCFYAKSFVKRWFNKSDRGKDLKNQRSFIIQNVIVLDGELILASRRTNSFDIEPVNHLLLRTTDSVSSVEDSSTSLIGSEVIIDVVKASFFEEYIEICKSDAKLFKKHISEVYLSGLLELS